MGVDAYREGQHSKERKFHTAIECLGEDDPRCRDIGAGGSASNALCNLFEAFFWSPRPGVPQERFFVRAGTVPASQVQDFRFQLESRVLPEFIAWACGILALPLNSTVRRSDQEFRW